MSSDFTIAAAEWIHETNTFSRLVTDLSAFERSELLRGAEIGKRLRHTDTAMAGFFDGAEEFGYLLIPILACRAPGAGIVSSEAFEGLLSELVNGIVATRPNGVLLALHGAMVTTNEDDADGRILERVREVVGPDVAIVATIDLHANISERMVDNADVLLGSRTYPHTDQRERAREASEMLMRVIRQEVTPVTALVKPPMMPTATRMLTDEEPMAIIMEAAEDAEELRHVLDVTIAGGFSLSNTPDIGLSVLVTTDADPRLAETIAADLGRLAWKSRDGFLGGISTWESAADALRSKPDGPLVLVDTGDHPLAGGTGGTTALLRFLLDECVHDAALAPIVDPRAVKCCLDAGPGADIELTLGGPDAGEEEQPLTVAAHVRLLSDGTFVSGGPLRPGQKINLGPTAVVVIQGISVVLTSLPEAPTDLNMFRAHGIEPTAQRVVALKGKGDFRAAFEPIASRVVLVEGPGLTSGNLQTREYTKLARPMWPIDRTVSWGDDRAGG